jgi:D-3-phosphoglycerate dehydrogenase/C-terminal binding protein
MINQTDAVGESGPLKIVITDVVCDTCEPEQKVLGDLGVVTALDSRGEDDLVGRIEDVDAIILYHSLRLSHATLDRLERCRFILCCGVGYDNIDYDYAAKMSIPVANLPDYGTEEVADSTIGLMLSLTRGIAVANSYLRNGDGVWSHHQVAPLQRLRDKVMGVVGLGRIGSAAALRAKALGMDVAFYDPYSPDGYDKSLGIRRVERFEQLLEQSYVLSPHCPLTAETYHMIAAPQIDRMPRGSYLLNTSRGAVVDTDAIPDAIVSGRLAGAAIDVFAQEPPGDDDPLIAAWRDPQHPAHHRVLVNPHIAFYCEQGIDHMRVGGAKLVRRALLGMPVRTIINGVSLKRDSDVRASGQIIQPRSS